MDSMHCNALVTGASQGLGLALSAALAAGGARVVGVARTAGPLEAAMANIVARGGEAHALAADVGDPEAAARIAARAQALVGPLDLLIHNASTLGAVPLVSLSDTPPEILHRTFEVNVLGPFRLTQAVLGGMMLRGRGTVVAISSDAATEAYPTWGAYGASKAALDHLTRIWAAETEGSGVRFVAVDPGEMDTRMHADAMPEADPASLAPPAAVAQRILALLEQGVPGVRVAA